MAIHKSLAVALVAACALSLACSKRSELVGTGYSQTLNPKSAQVVIDDVARLVVQELTREKLVR